MDPHSGCKNGIFSKRWLYSLFSLRFRWLALVSPRRAEKSRQFIETFKKEWEIKNISDFNFNFVLFDFKAQQNEEDILETMLSTSKEPEQLIKPETP